MPRRTPVATIAVALLALIAETARAQAPEMEIAGGAFKSITHGSNLQYRVASGRLLAESTIASNLRNSQLNHTQSLSERVTVEINGGVPTVRYELDSPAEDLLIEVVAGKRFLMRRTGKALRGEAYEFAQPAQGELTLSVGVGDGRRVVHAKNLWCLALANEELCRKTLFPTLESLRPNWRLASTVAAIEESLLHLAQYASADDRRQWQAWVDELASPKYSRRMAAQRKLFAAGPRVATFLGELDEDRLDPEQRERVSELVARFDPTADDSVEQVTAWLASDPEVWVTLMTRPDEARRRLAGRQLAQCLGEPVDFDPGADAATRGAQLDRLRTRVAANAAAKQPVSAPPKKAP